jgi:diketogulonate reductase-like aldo/keto reductase
MSKQRAFSVATGLSSTIQLNDGVVMPLFGLGVFRAGEGILTDNAVLSALHAGYRMFDTAQYYGNEAEVARALKNSSVKRDEVFVVSKVWTSNHGYDATTASVHESLSKMKTDSIDMFLIHSTIGGKVVETYKALLDLKAKGHIRSVGVSNFGNHHLEGLKAAGLPPPSVNQIELHPFAKRPDIVQYCRDHNIAVMGYSPMARGQKDDDPDLISIAKNHQRTIAQVMIRWSLQKGFITIPKSSKQERIVANAQIFDFELTDQEMQTLDSKPENFNVAWNPTKDPWVD